MASVGNPVKSKRPADSAFKQQRLPAWQPILTAGTVLPTFFIIGIAFIPIGIGLLYFSNEVKEYSFDYTQCASLNDVNKSCAEVVANGLDIQPCKCRLKFSLLEDIKGDVFMYYGLSNFYQNHRRYVKSRDDFQLLGTLNSDPSADCDPFSHNNGKAIAPCGAIANSLFNDTITLSIYKNGGYEMVPLLKTGIAWPSDKKYKFKNPSGPLEDAFKDFSRPVAWHKNVWELDLQDPSNNGFQNEDFIVWMRTAALPNFRKLYRRINHSDPAYANGLPKGDYEFLIEYNYGVMAFEGTKRIILSNTSMLGGKNPFLGVAYIVVGGICFLLGVIFLIIHIKCGKSSTEVVNVNPNTPYQ